MKRILQVVQSLDKNGTETFIMNLFRNIDRTKFMFDFLIFKDSKEGFYDEALSLGAEVYYIPPRKSDFIGYHKKLDKFFKEHAHKYDAVHKHDMSLSSIAPLYYAKKYGIPKRIMHIHGANCLGRHNQMLHKLNKCRVSGIVTQALACSRKAADWGFSNTSLTNKTTIISNGIDVDRFKFNLENRKKIRESIGINDNETLIIHIGYFNAIKNHRFLVDTFCKLLKHKPDFKLICVGEGGPLYYETKEYVKTLGIPDRVIFTGKRNDIPDLLSAADVMVFPSLHEGLGFVLLEAQASNLPIIASSGVSEEAKMSDSYTILDLNQGYELWADRILEISQKHYNRDKKPELGKFNIQNTVSQISKIYS